MFVKVICCYNGTKGHGECGVIVCLYNMMNSGG